ncbi:ABC transporter substrate-binding protein [Leucobacter luti]|uniref:Monosaccharide ABC transporter substrate-binding protein (CUT2 family) n=1 Tax=Leucobacter luti TaxID=340320 RepID=A0A4Q7U0H1_9MICO|nr:ABC transporter substrate-binding protein [Leucobacter luti]MBL3699325.1 sugar ABC transporter substrate-binding protein [Leucobacter luti]RZT66835.1 monosaccharide ABC transporter substrate-binding protein (CUT2 family) [Leucobacter luti]
MNIIKRSAALLAVSALAVSLAACTTGSQNAESGSTESAGQLTEADLAGKTIGFIPGVNDPFYISMQCAIETAAEGYGLKVSAQIPEQFEAAVQTPIVNSMVATKPAALLIAPTDGKALEPPLKQAVDAGVPVGLVDTTLDDPELAFTSVATDNEQGGAAAADALAELVDGKGKVLVIAFKAGASTSDARQKGFEDQIATHSGIEYIGAQINDNDPAKAASIVQAAIAANPDLTGIFATNLFAAQGAATGLRNANAQGDVKIVGFDAGSTQIEQLERGDVQALVAQKPSDIGTQAVEQAVAYLTGGDVTPQIGTETVVITQENLESMQDAIYKESCS